MDLYHTGVPKEFEGRGLAKKLAAAAIGHFTEEKVKMRLSCWYLEGYAKKNPNAETDKLLV